MPCPKRRLSDRIDQGRGLVPADLVLKGGRVFDLITGDLVETDVAICGDTIVGVFGSYAGRREIDVLGPGAGAGLHRHASACGKLAGDAARVRPLRDARAG